MGNTDISKLRKKKGYIAIYDFCETLVDFQTGDEFIFFIGRETGYKRITNKERIRKRKPFSYMFRLCDRYVNWGRGNFNKLFILNELKGVHRIEIDTLARRYYEEMIKPHLIPTVVNRLIEDKSKGEVIIVSASYMPFVRYFGKEYKIDTIITNEFEYKNGIFTGRLKRNDCWGREKVKRLFEKIEDFKEYYSVSYSDSCSDLPILEIADEPIVVSKGEQQNWASDRGYEQIIWNVV